MKKKKNSLLQHHSSKASILQCSAFFIVQLSYPYKAAGKTIALTRQTFVGQVMSQLFNKLSRLIMEKSMATHSSTLAWKIPWMEEPGRLQSMGSWRVTTEQLHFHFHALEKEMATHSSVLAENPRDSGDWWAAIYGVAQSWTRLRRLNSSSSRLIITFLPRSKCLLLFMAAVTICSDFGAPQNKVCHCFHCFPIYLPWSDGTRCHDLSFLNVES